MTKHTQKSHHAVTQHVTHGHAGASHELTSTTPPQGTVGDQTPIAANTAYTAPSAGEHIIAGAGDTLTGATGKNEYVIGANLGTVEITNFDATGTDIIDLRHSGLSAATLNAGLSNATFDGKGDALIALGNGTTIQLDGISSASQLSAANFELPGQHSGGNGNGGDSHGHDHHGPAPVTPPTPPASPFSDYIKILGTSGDNSLTAGASNTILYGAGGNDTLVAGAGNDLLVGGAGNDSIIGGTGNDTMISGGGNDILTGGGGNNVFSFGGGKTVLGNSEITDFNVANDKISLEHVGLTSATFDSLAIADNAAGNAVITFASGGTVTLDGVHASALSAADFILH